MSFSSYACSSFVVALVQCHCSSSLSSSVSKYIYNPLIKTSDVDFCSMVSVTVLFLSYFIFSISLEGYVLFKTLWWFICSSIFFASLVCSRSLGNIYFFSRNSVICKFCSTVLSAWNFCKRAFWVFNFLSAVAGYFFTRTSFVSSSICIVYN